MGPQGEGSCHTNLGTLYIMLPSWRAARYQRKVLEGVAGKSPLSSMQLVFPLVLQQIPSFGGTSSAKGHSC